MNFDDNGNLSGGIIKGTQLSDIHQFLVVPFSGSTTRQRNFDCLTAFINDLNDHKRIISKFWLDGSFCTNKENPNDIDMIIFIKPSPDGIALFRELKNNHGIIKQNNLDVYPCLDKNFLNQAEFVDQMEFFNTFSQFDYQEKYWMGQFGFDRNQNHKAIVELILDGGDTVG